MRCRLLPATLAVLVLASACSGGEATPAADRDPVATAPAASPAAPARTGGNSTEPGAAKPAKAQPRASSKAPRPGAAEQTKLDRQLIAAAWANDLPRARTLIRRGADVNAQDDTRQSAYLIATSEGFLELLELTLRHGADVNAKDSFHGTGLIRAADRGHAAVAGRLIQAGVSVDHVNNLGWTALHEAVILGDGSARYLATVRVLVAAGADVRLRSQRDQMTPLAHAESRGFDDIAAVLKAASDADRPSKGTAGRRLLVAAADGDATRAALALRAGASLETRDDRRRTPLLLAVRNDRLAVARLLVHLGADPDALDDQHDTPWLVTGVTGSVAMADLLLSARPDLGLVNRFGGTSLIPASERGHVDYVRRVVRTEIDVDHVNDLGWTALLEAVILGDGSKRYQEVVATLLAAGADRRLADRNGVTALEHAQRRGHSAIVDLLRS